jgi:hypothetical protein
MQRRHALACPCVTKKKACKRLSTGAGAVHTPLIDYIASFGRGWALLVGCGCHVVSVFLFPRAMDSADSGTAFLDARPQLFRKRLEYHMSEPSLTKQSSPKMPDEVASKSLDKDRCYPATPMGYVT